MVVKMDELDKVVNKFYNDIEEVTTQLEPADLKKENQFLKQSLAVADNVYCKRNKEYLELKDKLNKIKEYINKNWDGSSYIDNTLKYKVSELNITDILDIIGEE